MIITEHIFGLDAKGKYAPVIFREREYSKAIATAIYAESTLYIWNENASEWDKLFSPFSSQKENIINMRKYGIQQEQLSKEDLRKKRRYDCLFEKTDSYYYSGAGIILLPEKRIVRRCSLFEDKELAPCPLGEYDLYSDADYQEAEQWLHGLLLPDTEEDAPDDDGEISLASFTSFHRVYTYLPYSHWRLKQILNDYFNMHMVCIRAYKEGRYAGYKQRYNLYLNNSGKLFAENIHLDTLRSVFAQRDIPLNESDTKRNQGAEEFLAIINQIAEQQKQ